MTLNYGLFDVSDPENPDRVYSAALLSRIVSKHIRDGIVHGDGGELAVSASDPPAMSVQVGTGTAMVQGRFCENDAALTLSVPAADTTYARIDRVVVRLNASPGRTIDIVVKAGTAAPEPAAPALTRTPETWEVSLAQVRVEAGATSILSAKITDERGDASLCGVACPAYVLSSQLEVVGPVDVQGKALTGLPAPSGATDAARKGYVDTEIAGAIGGFGISDIAIDADKDWGGKNITNIGQIGTQTYRLVPCDPHIYVLYQNTTQITKDGNGAWQTMRSVTVPANQSGKVSVYYRHRGIGAWRITVNGTPVPGTETEGYGSDGTIDRTDEVPVSGGDVIAVQFKTTVWTIIFYELAICGIPIPNLAGVAW